MFERHGLALSLPPEECGGWTPPAAVYPPETLVEVPLPPSLRRAVALIADASRRLSVPMRCIARPEMFTHDQSTAWLKQRLGDVGNHLYLSNGATVRVLPGMRNHVFFYDVASSNGAAAFATLQRRAPELLGGLAAQVWTTFTIAGERRRVPTLTIFPGKAASATAPVLRGFCLRPSMAGLGAEVIEAHDPVDWSDVSGADALTYIPLTEVACADGAFMRAVARRVLRGFFEDAARVVIRLPELRPTHGADPHGLAVTLRALTATSVALPRARTTRVLLSDADLDTAHVEKFGGGFDLLLHASFELWRHTENFYAAARRIVGSESPAPTSDGEKPHVMLGKLGAIRGVGAPAAKVRA